MAWIPLNDCETRRMTVRATTRQATSARRVPQRIFLLSPADCGGQRARLIVNSNAAFDLAVRLRGDSGAPLGEVFSFLSGLYFRGKLAYARAFARPSANLDAVQVITAGDGLQSSEMRVTLSHLERYAATPVDPDEPRYRLPLARDLGELMRRLDDDSQVVLLGSLASSKYLDVLVEALGGRLHVPPQLIGLGDMSRGSLLLRCVAEGRELDYTSIADVDARKLPRRVRMRL